MTCTITIRVPPMNTNGQVAADCCQFGGGNLHMRWYGLSLRGVNDKTIGRWGRQGMNDINEWDGWQRYYHVRIYRHNNNRDGRRRGERRESETVSDPHSYEVKFVGWWCVEGWFPYPYRVHRNVFRREMIILEKSALVKSHRQGDNGELKNCVTPGLDDSSQLEVEMILLKYWTLL